MVLRNICLLGSNLPNTGDSGTTLFRTSESGEEGSGGRKEWKKARERWAEVLREA